MTFERQMEHPERDLSAYLDRELAPDRAAEVERHLASCPSCAARAAELRATARLIAALPAPRPAARLVPPLATAWSWLRPLRSLSAVASGAFVLLFIASATLSSGYRFGMEYASRPTSGAGAPAAPAALEDASKRAAQGTLGPAPAADASRALAPVATAVPGAAPTAAPAAAQGATPRTDLARELGAPPAAGSGAAARAAEPPTLGSPWLWLALALATAVVAAYAHRRLRSA